MPNDIVLIGPQRAGKSTIAAMLAEQLGLPRLAMDDVRFGYYAEIGYAEAFAAERQKKEGFAALYFYWKEFECHAAERLLANPPGGVIDFGAEHAVYESESQFARVATALEPYPNVILLLPSADPETALRVTHERLGYSPWPDRIDLAAHFLRHPSNARLAKHTFYTDVPPEEVCEQITGILTA